MATVEEWNPFDMLLSVMANPRAVTRISATQFTVHIDALWTMCSSVDSTDYGMTASSGGGSATLNKFGMHTSEGSASFIGTYSISGNDFQSKTVTVSFKHFNDDNGQSAYKDVSFSVSVPAWTSYTVSYDANGGSGAPGNQTKWKDQNLTISADKPTWSGYTFIGWATSSTATSAAYYPGGTFSGNYSITLYAVWSKNSMMTINFDANGGTNAPASQIHVRGARSTIPYEEPTRQDCYFLGWSTLNTGDVAYKPGDEYVNDTFVNGSSTTLYAVFERMEQILVNIPDGKTLQGIFVKVPDDKTLTEIYFKI